MKNALFVLLAIFVIVGIGASCMWSKTDDELDSTPIIPTIVKLPEVNDDGDMSLEETLLKRRSVRSYLDEPVTQAEVSQLLWAAQGISEAVTGKRTAPSAGALYPLEIYLAAGDVVGLSSGIYKYRPLEHELVLVKEGDLRGELARAALDQESVRDAAAALVFAAVYERTTQKYGDRGIQYVHIEVGHAAQNVFLQAVSLGLGTVVVGAFDDGSVREVIGLEADEQPLYIMPIGRI